MQRERVSDSIIVFTSDNYAQVTSGLILTSEGAVLIDTLAFPKETQAIRRFAEERLHHPIAYVVNTHYHADHTTGTCFFPDATVISHTRCRQLLDTRGRESLAVAQAVAPEMEAVTLVLPDLVFDDEQVLRIGDKTLHFRHSPGHSPDSIVCLVEEDQVLFAADSLIPVPHFVDGNIDDLRKSLYTLLDQPYEVIVQGHGEVVLRGEIRRRVHDDIKYLDTLETKLDVALQKRDVDKALKALTIEACGKSRVSLQGIGEQLHRQNIAWLRSHRQTQIPLESDQ
jgi:cyclase